MSLLIDFKYALRLLFKDPKFTGMTLAVLIGGLSISLFTFSFLYSTFYKPLPMPEGESALAVSVTFKENASDISAFEFNEIKSQLTSFAEIGIYQNKNVRLLVDESGKDIPTSYVDAGFFNFSRTLPIMGRAISSNDLTSGASPVAVISYETWQNELSGDAEVLTQTLRLNGIITDIIGVMPRGYRFPGVSKIWLPLAQETINAAPSSGINVSTYARLKKGIDIATAEKELDSAVDQIYQQNVALYQLPEGKKHVELMTFPMAQTGGQGSNIFTFLNIVAWMILLLACINVGNLLLARSIDRQKETAIRAALGASTKRLVSQLMWEGVIITVLGGILSLLLVGAALDYTNVAIHSWIPNGTVFWWQWGMDMETVGMGVVFTLVTILFAAFLPAWRSARQDINTTLRDGTRGAQSKKAGRLSRILVTTQVFIVGILMLIGAMSGYISQSFINLDLGDDYTNVMRASVPLPVYKYPEPQQQANVYLSLMERISNHPQVEGVVTNNWMIGTKLTIDSIDYASENDKPLVDTISVIGDTQYVGLNLVDGRQFNNQDKIGNRKVAMISQSMANRYWPGESAIGKNITLELFEKNEVLNIVGIVTNRMNPMSLFGKLDSDDEVYISGLQFVQPQQLLYYRIRGSVVNGEEIFYKALFATDRSIELDDSVYPAERNRNKMRESMRIASNVTFGTGLFALMLAMVGIYGLTSNSVAQRTHEVGIRRAVGATDKSIVRMFIKQGARQLIIGLGLALAIYSLLALGFHEFTLGLFPPYLYIVLGASVAAILSTIVMFAIYAPTRRAVRMEPSSALRYE
ncbi:ABC transporter permease [Colwelliaceae bacterium 6471]